MPFVLIIVGSVFIVSGVKGTSTQLLSLLRADLTGKDSYLYWLLAILVIGSLGYIQALRPVSRAFTVLVVIVLILSNKGVFTKFNSQLFGASTSATTPNPATGSSSSGSSSSSSGSSSNLPSLGSLFNM